MVETQSLAEQLSKLKSNNTRGTAIKLYAEKSFMFRSVTLIKQKCLRDVPTTNTTHS